jgi:hypothetical protein
MPPGPVRPISISPERGHRLLTSLGTLHKGRQTYSDQGPQECHSAEQGRGACERGKDCRAQLPMLQPAQRVYHVTACVMSQPGMSCLAYTCGREQNHGWYTVAAACHWCHWQVPVRSVLTLMANTSVHSVPGMALSPSGKGIASSYQSVAEGAVASWCVPHACSSGSYSCAS